MRRYLTDDSVVLVLNLAMAITYWVVAVWDSSRGDYWAAGVDIIMVLICLTGVSILGRWVEHGLVLRRWKKMREGA